jgi:hypothetical protein
LAGGGIKDLKILLLEIRSEKKHNWLMQAGRAGNPKVRRGIEDTAIVCNGEKEAKGRTTSTQTGQGIAIRMGTEYGLG